LAYLLLRGDGKLNLAHPGKRFQEQFIDGLIAYVLGLTAFYFLDIVLARELAVYSGFLVGIAYFLFSDAMPNGQSFGKKLLNIQVVNANTKHSCRVLESFLRNITFPLGFFDWVFIFFGKHRRLGDFIASTIVIKKSK
jgi:uncharacterized RDD family membrane protein YckC